MISEEAGILLWVSAKINHAKNHRKVSRVKAEKLKGLKHLTLYDDKIDHQLEACFFKSHKETSFASRLDNESSSNLWVNNLHSLEDLLSNYTEENHNFHLQL